MAKQTGRQKRTNRVEIFFSDEEKQALELEAEKQGVPRTQVLRSFVRGLMRQQEQESKAAS